MPASVRASPHCWPQECRRTRQTSHRTQARALFTLPPGRGSCPPCVSYSVVAPTRCGATGWAPPPVHLAAIAGRTRCVAALLDHGVSRDLPDIAGRTPLQEAVQGGHLDTARFLVARGADVNIRDHQRRSALSKVFDKLRDRPVASAMESLLLQAGAERVLGRKGPVPAPAHGCHRAARPGCRGASRTSRPRQRAHRSFPPGHAAGRCGPPRGSARTRVAAGRRRNPPPPRRRSAVRWSAPPNMATPMPRECCCVPTAAISMRGALPRWPWLRVTGGPWRLWSCCSKRAPTRARSQATN